MAAWYRMSIDHKSNSRAIDTAPQVVRITMPYDQGSKPSYARDLRVVGQALEKFNFRSVHLEWRAGIYTVRGQVPAELAATFSLIHFIRDLARGGKSRRRADQAIEIAYSKTEIDDLDELERGKRADSDKLPDPYGISQILRGVGIFLDARQAASLQEVNFQDRCVSVTYRSAEGRAEYEKQDLDYFYDYGVKMYLRRSNRTNAPTPTEPTLYVQWEQDLKRHRTSKSPI